MIASPERTRKAGRRLALERLAIYHRYAELVAGQEEAVLGDDLETFHALAEEALELQAHLGTLRVATKLADGPDAASPDFIDEVMDLLRATAQRNERIQSRLHTLRAGARDEVNRVSEGRSRARRYTENDAERIPNVDVRF